jgi:SAM-dependent MidA family methyltransferase
MGELAGRLARDGGAALILDYGYWGPAFGDTLQALRNHQPVDPLEEPGEADLTTHVDFHRLAQAAAVQNARVHGIVTQGDFLRSLGIEARASTLKARATPAQAADIDRALTRLTEPGSTGMGELFKVLAVTHEALQAVPGLPALPSSS